MNSSYRVYFVIPIPFGFTHAHKDTSQQCPTGHVEDMSSFCFTLPYAFFFSNKIQIQSYYDIIFETETVL